ncbi:MAG: NACHT domain-containing protein, partial [Caldilineaceae bacterium]|nr:NACHT domain-containing protein [Caldilineaceae bacterium]
TMPLEQLERKAELYRGEFLHGFDIPDVPEFEEWLVLERESLRQQAIHILTALAGRYLQLENYKAGLTVTRRLLEIEPWYEIAHQQQMLLLAMSGQRTAALAQYETCCAVLRTEFDAEPSAEMIAQYNRIKLHGEFGTLRSDAPEIHPENAALAAPLPEHPVHRQETVVVSGEMPQPTTFYGRQLELTELTQWFLVDQARVVGLLGTGGTGKTLLAAELVRAIQQQDNGALAVDIRLAPFTQIIWRSLVNAPSLSTLLLAWLQLLSDQQQDQLPTMVSEQIDLLFAHLRKKRCLLILDNLESILSQGDQTGAFRDEYLDYEYFFRRMGETEHRSCLLFTSRELPMSMARLERSYPRVRSYMVRGLDAESCVRLLRAEGLNGAQHELLDLGQRYSGNPLALKIVAETIQDLFGGDVEMLLHDRTLVFDDIRAVLDQQINRLSSLEIEILCWLAVERTPTTLKHLAQNWLQPPPRAKFLDAVRSLQRRSLLEHALDAPRHALDPGDRAARFVLQNVVMEFVSELLIERIFRELVADNAAKLSANEPLHSSLWLNQFGLVKAQSQAYLRDAQTRLLLQPLVRRLLGYWGHTATVNHLRQWLDSLRTSEVAPRGYAGANLFHLLRQLDVALKGWNFSRLSIRQADFRTAVVADLNLQGADLTEVAFINTIGIIPTIAVSQNGRLLAAGSSDGSIHIWHTADFQLANVLRLHTQGVQSIQFSHDGTMLASGGHDGLLCLWQVDTGKLITTLPKQGKSIISFAFSRDDRVIAAATTDELVHLWDWQRGQEVRTLAVSATVTDMALSPDGQWLACVGDEQLIKVWHFARGELVGTMRGHEDKILAVAFDAQSERLATGGEDGRIYIWNVATFALEQVLTGHTDLVLAVAFDPTGKYLASNSADQTTRVWHAESGKLLHVLRGHRGWILGLAFSPTGHALFTGGYDQTIRLWDLKDGTQQHQIRGHYQRVDFLRFSHNGTLLAASGLDGTVYLWDVASASLVHTLSGPKAATRALDFNSNDTLFATASDDGSIRLWEVATGQVRHTLLGHGAPARYIRFAGDDGHLISGSHDRTIAIWNVATGVLERAIPDAVATSEFACDVNPRRPELAFGTYDQKLVFLNPQDGAVDQTIDIAPMVPSTVVYSPDGRLLVCGTQEGCLLIYDRTTKATAPLYQVQVTQMPIWSLYFSPDGAWLAWICAGQRIHRLNLTNGQLCEPIPSYFGAYCLGFTQGGQYFLTDSADNSVLLREKTTGEVYRRLLGHKAGLTNIKVSPTGELVASSSVDGVIHLWNPTSGQCLATLKAPGPYAGMNIANVSGISQAQRNVLLELDAIEHALH